MQTTINTQQGGLYAGPTLPQGGVLLGTVTRDVGVTGALVSLPSGQYVQWNAGVMRTLPPWVGIAAHRETCGMTQQQLAQEWGVSVDWVKSIETGRRGPKPWMGKYLRMLADVLD